MAILKELGDDLLACNQSKVLADDRKNIAQCIKKIEPKTPLRRSLRLQNMRGRVSPRLQEKSDEQKTSYGTKRKSLSDDLIDQVSKKETEVVPVEDISCRSDLETGCNNGDAQVVSDSMRVTMTLFRCLYNFYVFTLYIFVYMYCTYSRKDVFITPIFWD